MFNPLVIGTRGSALALYQARLVERLLKEAHPELETEIQIIETIGDKDRKTSLAKVSEVAKVQRGIFIKELEEALSKERVHIAVHSLKDIPSVLNDGFALPCFLSRGAREDVLVSKHKGGINGLPKGARVATGGVRRQCQLKWLRPDIEIVEIRGNVPTRLKKTAVNPDLDATMLAAAGLERLDYPVGSKLKLEEGDSLFLHSLPVNEFLPAGGQGVVAIECLTNHLKELESLISPLNCSKTEKECATERAFLHQLGASCDTPIAAMATDINHGKIELQARYWKEGEVVPVAGLEIGEEPDEIAKNLVNRLNLVSQSSLN